MDDLKPALARRAACTILAAFFALAAGSAPASADRPTPERDGFLKDPQCGSKAAMDSLVQFFRAQTGRLAATGEIVGQLRAAASAAPAVRTTAAAVLADETALLAEAAGAGAAARREAEDLLGAMKDVSREADSIGRLDLAGLGDDGAALTSIVAPFAATCGDCASAMALAPPGARGGGGPCAGAVAGSERSVESLARLRKLVGTAVAVVESARRSASRTGEAADLLVKMAPALGASARPLLGRLETNLNRAGESVNALLSIAENEIAPRLSSLGRGLSQQLGDSVRKLLACYGKLLELFEPGGSESAAVRTRLKRLPDLQALPVLREGSARPVSRVVLPSPRGGGSR